MIAKLLCLVGTKLHTMGRKMHLRKILKDVPPVGSQIDWSEREGQVKFAFAGIKDNSQFPEATVLYHDAH